MLGIGVAAARSWRSRSRSTGLEKVFDRRQGTSKRAEVLRRNLQAQAAASETSGNRPQGLTMLHTLEWEYEPDYELFGLSSTFGATVGVVDEQSVWLVHVCDQDVVSTHGRETETVHPP